MIVITNITNKLTGERKIFTPVWYHGSYKFEFYNTETKETFTRSMDMYRAKRFFESTGALHSESFYVSISKRCLRLADYIDYVGTWNKRYLSSDIQEKLSEADGFDINYIDDDIGFFVSITDGFHAMDVHLSIVEALFELKHIIVNNTIYINAIQDVVYEYKIEDVKHFNILYTKLKIMGVGR